MHIFEYHENALFSSKLNTNLVRPYEIFIKKVMEFFSNGIPVVFIFGRHYHSYITFSMKHFLSLILI